VLKAERNTRLVIHLENLDPGIEINKHTSLKFATQIPGDFHRKGFETAGEAIIL
jgi:hypothetical protein